jgi:hypothetical protein
MEAGTPDTGDALRDQAVARLRKKRDFGMHAVVYVMVNALLVAIWAITGADFFWPVFPILGWGIGLAANAYDVYGRKPISEAEIEQEMSRLRDR